MADVVDKPTRSRMMAGIKGRNTKPELRLRTLLHKAGFRYRIHSGELPGKPDMVFRRLNAVVFVHGCFWHRHPGCRWATTPASNSEFWQEKLGKNVERDVGNDLKLRAMGWRVGTVWECALRQMTDLEITGTVSSWLRGVECSLDLACKSPRSKPSLGGLR